MSPFSILLLSSMCDSTLHREGAKSNARHSSARGGRSACASTRPFRAQCQRMGRECSPRRTSPPNALRAFFCRKEEKYPCAEVHAVRDKKTVKREFILSKILFINTAKIGRSITGFFLKHPCKIIRVLKSGFSADLFNAEITV